ncbi:MAG: hypothetical protein HFJ54_06735 [Clostridia bacterium]|nr:hypothetical protein [Clostridia bacterium]
MACESEKKRINMPHIARGYSRRNYYIMVQGINKESIIEKNKYIEKHKKNISNKLKDTDIRIIR